jgi:hypothetical protein
MAVEIKDPKAIFTTEPLIIKDDKDGLTITIGKSNETTEHKISGDNK